MKSGALGSVSFANDDLPREAYVGQHTNFVYGISNQVIYFYIPIQYSIGCSGGPLPVISQL